MSAATHLAQPQGSTPLVFTANDPLKPETLYASVGQAHAPLLTQIKDLFSKLPTLSDLQLSLAKADATSGISVAKTDSQGSSTDLVKSDPLAASTSTISQIATDKLLVLTTVPLFKPIDLGVVGGSGGGEDPTGVFVTSSINEEPKKKKDEPCCIEKTYKAITGSVGEVWSDPDAMQRAHRFIGSAVDIAKMSGASLPILEKMTEMAGFVDGGLDALGCLAAPVYVCTTVPQKRIRLIETTDATGAKKIEPKPDATPRRVGSSPCVNDIVNKPIRAAEKVSFIAASFASLFAFLDKIKVICIDKIVLAIASVPVLGALASTVAKIGLGVLAGIFFVIGSCAGLIKNISYLIRSQTDASKDKMKGWIQLLARIGEIVFTVFALTTTMSWLVVAAAGIASSVLTLSAMLYTNARKASKEEKQEALEEQYVRQQQLAAGVR